jgi:hypothetical protein
MLLRLRQFNGLSATARKAALTLQSKLFDVNTTLIVVLIILVLLAQSGVGLIA